MPRSGSHPNESLWNRFPFAILAVEQKPLTMSHEIDESPPPYGDRAFGSNEALNPHGYSRHRHRHLPLPIKDGVLYVDHDHILFLQAARSYTHVHCRGARHLVCMSLHALEALLPADRFFRCHRSHLINLTEVRCLHVHGGHRVEMSSSHHVEVSRRRMAQLKAVLN